MAVQWKLAPNIAALLATVKATPWMSNKGTVGNLAHLAGAGDHTPYSTHIGKGGYPTQGEVHAIDVGMTDAQLGLVETFIRRAWRKGLFWHVKYFNVLNRHWNAQTAGNWARAQAGTLAPRYSGDHHLHLSMENGAGGGDLLEMFVRWLATGQRFDDELPKPAVKPVPVAARVGGDDEMTTLLLPAKFAYDENGQYIDYPEGERPGDVVIALDPVKGGALANPGAAVGFAIDHGEVLLRVAYATRDEHYDDAFTVRLRNGQRIRWGEELPAECRAISVGRQKAPGLSAVTACSITVKYKS